MVGLRQSTLVSDSLGQAPAQAHPHFYSNNKQQNTSSLPIAQPFFNILAHQAIKTQFNGDYVMQRTIGKYLCTLLSLQNSDSFLQ